MVHGRRESIDYEALERVYTRRRLKTCWRLLLLKNMRNILLKLLGQEDNESRRQHLLANLEAQNLTIQTAVLYQQHLITQRSKMATARDKIAADLEIAQNTYKTVVLSRELIQLLRTSQHSFE